MIKINGKEYKKPKGVLISFFDPSGHFKAFESTEKGNPARWVIKNNKESNGENLRVRLRLPASYSRIKWELEDHSDVLEAYKIIGTDNDLDQFEEFKLVLKPQSFYELKFQSFIVV